MEDLPLDKYLAISPVDGRYAKDTKELKLFFSEYALQKARTLVEIEYLMHLSEHPQITHVRDMSEKEKRQLQNIYLDFDIDSMKRIKEIEKETNHDVKSVEYFVKEKLKGTSLEDLAESVHFALTSEDCTNTAYAILVNGAIEAVFAPQLKRIIEKLAEYAHGYADVPMLARTHGQPASPTTVGKEFVIFANELKNKYEKLVNFSLPAKLNGATGNYNALTAAYPDIDGFEFTIGFMNRLGLEPKLFTTQVDGYAEYAELFNLMKEINTIIRKLDVDMWMYISYDYFVLKKEEKEVGSSTMPHKVNPINFENSEGNTKIANAIFNVLAEELPTTRMQRDLSGSTMLRAMGEAFGHTLIAWKNTLKGLRKITPNIDYLVQSIEEHPELLAEPIQTILRREGISGAYEQLKALTRGRKITKEDLLNFVDGLDVPPSVKEELTEIINAGPSAYIGEAAIIVDKLIF
ncbi:MAG: adenylosuccinate lyase [Nanoarchaeota archaeon]|nr:adenylosuccinate lyase [Nanoarchaeota archaeon]